LVKFLIESTGSVTSWPSCRPADNQVSRLVDQDGNDATTPTTMSARMLDVQHDETRRQHGNNQGAVVPSASSAAEQADAADDDGGDRGRSNIANHRRAGSEAGIDKKPAIPAVAEERM
jgi:hypothetical protein